MKGQVFATFPDSKSAQHAASALLDIGLKSENITLVEHRSHNVPIQLPEIVSVPTIASHELTQATSLAFVESSEDLQIDELDVDYDGMQGIPMTSSIDVDTGAPTGVAWAIGAGAMAALPQTTVPGVGLVIGAGDLGLALIEAANTGEGRPHEAIRDFVAAEGFTETTIRQIDEALASGGAFIAVSGSPEGVDQRTVCEILDSYSGVPLLQGTRGRSGYLG